MYEEAYWQVLNIRNGKAVRPDGRKVPLNVLMKHLGFTNDEMDILDESQANSDRLVKKEVMAMNAIKGIYDVNISKLIKPNESKRDFAIRIVNDESYNYDKAIIMNPINSVIQLVDKRTQIELIRYDVLNLVFIFISFFIVLLLFIRFIFLINSIKLHLKKEKERAEKESLLRKIFETIRGSLDLNIVKNTIVTEVGKALNADRCFLWGYDKSTGGFMVDQSSEYRSSDDVVSLIGINSKDQNINWLTDFYKLGNEVLFNNVDQFIKENNLEGSSVEQYFQKYNTKSNYSIPIINSGELLGSLIVQYTKDYKVLSQEDINFIETLASQAGVAIYQSKLYEKEEEMVVKEKVIAHIIAKTVSTFDVNQIKHMVKHVGVITKADRCYFVEIDLKNMKGKSINNEEEYLASSDIKSIIGYDFPTEDAKKFIETVLETRDLSVFDYEEMLKNESEQYAGPKRYASQFGLKNSIGIPFYYMNNLTAILVIEYVRVKTIPSAEELDFLRILGNQVGLAFSQIQNYKNTLKIAEHEKALRKIMMDSVNIFDTTEVIKLIIVEAGKLLKADRCFFAKFDIENDTIFPAPEYSEYLATNDIVSLFSRPITKDETDSFIAELKQKKLVIVEDVNKIDFPEITRKMLIEEFSVKSYLTLPVRYRETLYGALVLHYVQDFRQFTKDEIDVAMAIANQTAIVLHQTELHLADPKT